MIGKIDGLNNKLVSCRGLIRGNRVEIVNVKGRKLRGFRYCSLLVKRMMRNGGNHLPFWETELKRFTGL